MDPMLSIIIPAYNVERYLPDCLESVLKQDNGRLEILVVDDQSTDATAVLAEQYAVKYPQIRVFKKENGGPSAARNLGIEQAAGEYILFLDSDDQLADGAVAAVFNLLDAAAPDVIVGRYSSFYESPADAEICDYRFDADIIRSRRGEQLLAYLVQDKVYDWYAWLYVIKTSLIRENNLYFEVGVDFAEDARLVPALLCAAEAVEYLDRPFYLYRRNRGGSITATFSEKYFNGKLEYFNFLQRFCDERRFSDAVRTALFVNMANMYVSTLFDAWYFSPDKRKAYLKTLRPYTFILARSPRRYHRVLYAFYSVFGLNVMSYILYLRAASIRRKITSKAD